MLAQLLAGVAMGLSVAIPFGPVSLVCIRRSVMHGRVHGMVAGLAAATAQCIFAMAAIAYSDVAAASLSRWAGEVRILSAAILIILGLRMLLRRGATPDIPRPAGAVALPTYVSTLCFALANPMTILPYLAVASGETARARGVAAMTVWSVPGVTLGAAAWYAALSTGATMLKPGVVACATRYMDAMSGLILVCFGLRIGIA